MEYYGIEWNVGEQYGRLMNGKECYVIEWVGNVCGRMEWDLMQQKAFEWKRKLFNGNEGQRIGWNIAKQNRILMNGMES